MELPMTADLAARWVLMSSYLYYVCDSPVLSDADFDRLCKMIVKRWHKIDPLRQWQLGSPEKISASGFHCRYSSYTVNAALAWHKAVKGEDVANPRWQPRRKKSKKFGIFYMTS